jgi:plasmid stability protein
MASLLIKNIPPEIHLALKEKAAKNHRSLNREIISVLEKEVELADASVAVLPDYSEETLASYPPEVAARLRSLRDMGESMGKRQVDFERWKEVARDSRR